MDRGCITLIGMPSSGKSTIGVVLAKMAGMRFLAGDLLIQEKTGKRLMDLIAEYGDEGFREIVILPDVSGLIYRYLRLKVLSGWYSIENRIG